MKEFMILVDYIGQRDGDGVPHVLQRLVRVQLEHVNTVRGQLGLKLHEELTFGSATAYVRDFGIYVAEDEVIPPVAIIKFKVAP